jgi:hypothetical protein
VTGLFQGTLLLFLLAADVLEPSACAWRARGSADGRFTHLSCSRCRRHAARVRGARRARVEKSGVLNWASKA